MRILHEEGLQNAIVIYSKDQRWPGVGEGNRKEGLLMAWGIYYNILPISIMNLHIEIQIQWKFCFVLVATKILHMTRQLCYHGMCKNLYRNDCLDYSKIIFSSNLNFKKRIVSERDPSLARDTERKFVRIWLTPYGFLTMTGSIPTHGKDTEGGLTKWLPFCRQPFQMHFLERKCYHFVWNFPAISSWGSNW